MALHEINRDLSRMSDGLYFRDIYASNPLPEDLEPDAETYSITEEGIWAAIHRDTQGQVPELTDAILHEAPGLTSANRFYLRGSVDPPR